jgi:hypothetical protein
MRKLWEPVSKTEGVGFKRGRAPRVRRPIVEDAPGNGVGVTLDDLPTIRFPPKNGRRL